MSCQHRARRGARAHEPRDHDLSQSWTLNQWSHPGAPFFSESFRSYFLIIYFLIIYLYYLFIIYFLIIYLYYAYYFESDRAQAEEGQREGDTESKGGFRL